MELINHNILIETIFFYQIRYHIIVDIIPRVYIFKWTQPIVMHSLVFTVKTKDILLVQV